MQVDYSRLLMERKISMKNIPSGSVRIRLSGKDMGNFVSHPLFQDAAQTAVQVGRHKPIFCWTIVAVACAAGAVGTVGAGGGAVSLWLFCKELFLKKRL
jgi:hypothetical protein